MPYAEYIEQGAESNNLHALEWLKEDEIGVIPREWNHTVGIDPPNPDAKLVHYTMGTPIHPEIKGCEYTDEWLAALDAAVSSLSWSHLMGSSTWAMEISDGRRLPRLHPDARREADQIVSEVAAIRSMGYSIDKPSAAFAELSDINHQAAPENEVVGTFNLASSSEARALLPHIGPIRHLCRTAEAKTLLDYSGFKEGLYEARDIVMPDGEVIESIQTFWGLDRDVSCCDPRSSPQKNSPHGQSDGVVCVGLLEKVPLNDIGWVVASLFENASKFIYVVIASHPSGHTLPNGTDTHVTLKSKPWWEVLFRTIGQDYPDVRYYVIINRAVKTNEGKTALQGSLFQG